MRRDAQPTFAELCQDLEGWMQPDTPYLDMDRVDEGQPYYDASAVSAFSGSSWEGHTRRSSDSNNLALNDMETKFEITSF